MEFKSVVMDNIFSTKGLTSSEANHVTNVTKELVKDLAVDRLALFTAKAKRDGQTYPLDENKKVNFVDRVQKIGKLYSLSAWLKTAIKAKEDLIKGAERNYFVTSIASPDLEQMPPKPDTSFEVYLNQLNTKDRCEYLSKEAIASHVGAFVHNFDEIRRRSEDFTPTEFRKLGDNDIIAVDKERLYAHDELLEGFFSLQKQHREAEKVVNLYKSRHKSWEKEIHDDYSQECNAISSRNTDKQLVYNREVNAEKEAHNKSVREERQRISALKIIVPHDLQETLDYVNEYAKE